MSNERLRTLMAERGITVTALGEKVGVDRKTVERWITTGRTPHRTHRLTVAALLGKEDVYIWPDSVGDRQATAASAAELVTLFPTRGAVPLELWSTLLSGAEESIDLLAYAASFLHDAIPDYEHLLTERANAGVRIRLLFGDPDSPAVELRGEEESIEDLLSARCRLTWSYYERLLKHPEVGARRHGTTLYNSLFRFDNTLLVNTHAYGVPASHAPVLHLHRVAGGRLFEHYMSSFERAWGAGEAQFAQK